MQQQWKTKDLDESLSELLGWSLCVLLKDEKSSASKLSLTCFLIFHTFES